MKVKRNTLLLIACLVWSAAGVNILRIGLAAYPSYRSALNFLLSVLVFSVFQAFVFGKLVKKHTARIRSYTEERQFFLRFFARIFFFSTFLLYFRALLTSCVAGFHGHFVI